MLYQHITVYSSAIKYIRLIPGNVCVKAENFSIDPASCRKNPIKNKIGLLNCQPLLLEENYTGIKA